MFGFVRLLVELYTNLWINVHELFNRDGLSRWQIVIKILKRYVHRIYIYAYIWFLVYVGYVTKSYSDYNIGEIDLYIYPDVKYLPMILV